MYKCMWIMWHSHPRFHVWQDSFTSDWSDCLSPLWITLDWHIYLWHDPTELTCDMTQPQVTWRISIIFSFFLRIDMWYDSLRTSWITPQWHIYARETNLSPRVTWLIRRWHDVLICVTTHHVPLESHCHYTFIRNMIHLSSRVSWLIRKWHDSFETERERERAMRERERAGER